MIGDAIDAKKWTELLNIKKKIKNLRQGWFHWVGRTDHRPYLPSSNLYLCFLAGWWYNACFFANLNAEYKLEGPQTEYAQGIMWQTWKGYYYSLKTVSMKIARPTI